MRILIIHRFIERKEDYIVIPKNMSWPDNFIFDLQCFQVTFTTVIVVDVFPHIVSTPHLLYLSLQKKAKEKQAYENKSNIKGVVKQ